MTCKEHTRHVQCLIASRHVLIWVVSDEERRVLRMLGTIGSAMGYRTFSWDCASGAKDIEGDAVDLPGPPGNPRSVFRRIRDRTESELWILKDLSYWLREAPCERDLKSLTLEIEEFTDKASLAVIVVLTSDSNIPAGLQSVSTLLNWPLPTRPELAVQLDDVIAQSNVSVDDLSGGERDSVLDAVAGLTTPGAENAFSYSIVSKNGVIDAATVRYQKKQVIDRHQGLTWVEPDSLGLDSIGGYELLKGWLVKRREGLSQAAMEYGLQPPKGILLVGHPGCGKSMTARAVAAAWRLPILRMDMASFRGKFVGESEANLRKALLLAEAVSPVIIWIDEVERAFGSSSGRQDGGVSMDAMGTTLTWLQEKKGTIFVVATANDVSMLPPEFSRRGRFDEIFFVDLPNTPERAAIAGTALARHGRDGAYDLDAVAAATAGFSGAEIASLVPEGMYESFADGERRLATEDLLVAAAATVPSSRSSSEKIEALRAWAQKRARPASHPEPTSQTSQGAGSGRASALAHIS